MPTKITLEPSADIQLVLSPPARATLQLDVLSHDNTVVAPTSVRDKCTFAIANTAVAEVSAAGILTPKAVGRTFMTVVHTPATGPVTSVVARVSVHPGINEWWIGNNRASVHAGESDLLLSAYALFDGANVGDITGHGYATFTAPPGANATVDAKGRVTGVTAGDVTIRGTLNAVNRDVLVTVVPAPSSTLLPIVESVRLSGPMEQRRNVLFLAEGFTDRDKFVDLVQKVVDRLVTSPRVHEPFHILRDDINYWMAFEPSHENGLTPGPLVNKDGLMFMLDTGSATRPASLTFNQLVRLVGLPNQALVDSTRPEADAILHAQFPTYNHADLEDDVFAYWQTWPGEGVPQARDSRYGLFAGTRPGDRFFTAGPNVADVTWYFPATPEHSLLNDPRRSPPNVNRWDEIFYATLKSLRTRKGASDPNHVIGPRWARDGDDQGLVVLLCNEEVYGAYASPQTYSAVAIDFKTAFSNVTLGGVTTSVVDHEPDTTGLLTEVLVSTVAHELGHQFFLGDEYEGKPGLGALDPVVAGNIEVFDNLTTHFFLSRGTTLPALNPDLIKWNARFRIQKASRLAGPVTDGPGNNVLVPLAPGEGSRWRLGESVVLRTRNINLATNANSLFNRYPLYRRHAFHQRVNRVEAVAGDVITVDGGKLTAGQAFPAGSTLAVPKPNKAGTDALLVVLPGVRTFINGPPARAVVGKAGQCAIPVFRFSFPPTISGITLTADDRPRIIGLFEGGGEWNCNVYRSAPVCKMRLHIFLPTEAADARVPRSHFRFCFVCRYSIVNEVNPRRHPDLDLLYPGREA